MRVIVYTTEAGNVAVCYPSNELPIKEVQAKDTPVGSIIIDHAALPDANDFFEAWELNGEHITVNLNKARDITKQRLRDERAPLLAELDVAFQRALENGADTAAIVAEKQRLRDLPMLADSCNTLDQLRQLKAQ